MDKQQRRFWQGFGVKKKYLLSGLLAFSLTLLVWAAPAQQSPSPTSSLSPKEAVVVKIKAAAERPLDSQTAPRLRSPQPPPRANPQPQRIPRHFPQENPKIERLQK